MKKIKTILKILLFFVITASLHANDNQDYIVLLDLSESMLPYYDDVAEHLFKDIIENHLNKGDTFNLISFSDDPEIELTFEFQSSSDMNNVVQRMRILQPFGKHTDFIGALKYLYNFIKQLPEYNDKSVLILSDCIHDPSDKKQENYYGIDIENEFNKIFNSFIEEGWKINLIKFPYSADDTKIIEDKKNRKPSEITPKIEKYNYNQDKQAISENIENSDNSVIKDVTEISDIVKNVTDHEDPVFFYEEIKEKINGNVIEYEKKPNISKKAFGTPEVIFPEDLGKVRNKLKIPFVFINYNDFPVYIKLNGILWKEYNLLQKTEIIKVNPGRKGKLKAHVIIPESVQAGENILNVELKFKENLRVSPSTGNLSFMLKKGGFNFFGFVLKLFYIILIFLICGAVFIFFIRITREFIDKAGSPSVNIPHHDIKQELGHKISDVAYKPVEMRVIGQNPFVGCRNIHYLTDNSGKSVGGGSSSYVIFLYRFPSHIAEFRKISDGKYNLRILDNKYFPESDKEIKDCLNKEITAVNDSGHKVTIVFREWISPLEEINRIMRMAKS